MATLAVIYKIAADISSLESNVEKGVSTMSRLESGAVALGRTLRGAFTVGTVLTFVNQAMQAADELQRLSDKTGISVEGLSALEAVARESGNTLDQVTAAITQMQNRLASGDRSAVGALRELELSLEALRALEPDQQFRAIAQRVAEIPDPADRARLAMDLFGRSGAEILPTLRADIERLLETHVGWSQQTVTTLDALGDAWGRFWDRTKLAVANVTAMTVESLQSVHGWLMAVLEAQHLAGRASSTAASAPPPPRAGGPGPGLAPIALTLEQEKAAIKALEEQYAALRAEQERGRRAQAQWNDAQAQFRNFIGLRQMEDAAAALAAQAEQVGANVRLEFALNKMYRDNAASLGDYAGNVGLFTEQWVGFGRLAPGIVRNITDSGKALEGGFGSFLKKGLSNLFQNEKGEGATSVGEGFKNMLGGIGKGMFDAVGGLLTGGLSSLISGGIGLLGKGIGKLFGFDGEKKKVDEMRQAFIDQIGGWHQLNVMAQKTGMTLDAVLNARKVKDYEAAVAELTAAFEFQENTMAELDAAMQRYGISVAEAGGAYAALKLDEVAQGLFKDWTMLTTAIGDHNLVATKMAPAVNDYIHAVLQAGIEVPKAMEPMLQKMVELGLLTDANGTVITDLEASGIRFSMTMSEGFRALIDEVQKLTEAIARGLGIALENIPSPHPITIPIEWAIPELPQADIPGFARGTGGRYVDFGARTLAWLHGREMIVPEGASPDANRNADLAAMRADMHRLTLTVERQQRLLPKQLRDAMLLAS